jgi:methionine sulfoxide reductase heme-binding subunit
MAITSSEIVLNLHALSVRGNGIDPMLWYVTRAAGVSAYVLLAVVVDLGILLSLARQLETRASWVFDELHQFLALLAAAMIALHLGVLLIDPFITFSFANLLLPFGEPYQPLGISVGVLGLYALLILLASSWLRRFIPRRIWRTLHFVSFAAFVLVTTHGLLAGSDAGLGWLRSVFFAATASTFFLTIMRLVLVPRGAEASRVGPPRRPTSRHERSEHVPH